MVKIEFNKQGTPLMISGNNFVSTTSGAPVVKPDKLTVETLEGTSKTGAVEFSNWGAGNDFPQKADESIDNNSVLRTGIKYKYLFTLGQGIYPVNLMGYDDNGNEIVKVVDDAKVRRFVSGRMVRSYMEKTLRDYFKYGIAAAQLIPSADFSRMVGITGFNMRYSRLSELVKGEIKNLIYSGKFPDVPSTGEADIYSVLQDYDPEGDLLRRMVEKKEKSFAYIIRDNFSGHEIHSIPDWWTAKNAGWLDVTSKVPIFLKNAYDNAMYIKWHIKIPYQYWDKKFPTEDYKTTDERQKAINLFMDEFETNLTSSEKSNKAVFTMYETISGKVEEQWVIEALDTKSNFSNELATSAAGNSEILFSLMVTPSLWGPECRAVLIVATPEAAPIFAKHFW